MQIDWITVSAQIVNFLVLVWLLKRFLYQPILDAMDRRERRVNRRLHDAEEREQEADQRIQAYRRKAKELDEQRGELLAGAEDEAAEQKRTLVESAREEANRKRDAWQRQVKEEKEEFLDRLRREAAEAVQKAARRALQDLANAELERQVVDTFIERMESLDEDSRRRLAEVEETVGVASSFELGAGVRSRLTRAIHECIDEDADVEYTQSPDLVCGVELTRGEQRLSWHVAHYLEQLSARIDEALQTADSGAQRE